MAASADSLQTPFFWPPLQTDYLGIQPRPTTREALPCDTAHDLVEYHNDGH